MPNQEEREGRAILAYFQSPDDAQRAANRLEQELKITDTQIDRFGYYPGERTTQNYTNPIQGRISSHLNRVGGQPDPTPNEGRLAGSDPAISGMSDGDGQITGRDIILTVICPNDQVEQAVKIINECGGQH